MRLLWLMHELTHCGQVQVWAVPMLNTPTLPIGTEVDMKAPPDATCVSCGRCVYGADEAIVWRVFEGPHGLSLMVPL